MHDSRRFLHPEAIKRITRLDLRARHVVEGFLSGMHRSPYFGQSIEFRQHREYTSGDDLRHVDWKVWAKQDRYYVKQFEEDTNLRGTLLVDVSGSMRYGRGAMNKYEYGCTIGVQPGLPAAAAAGRRGLRVLRRDGADDRSPCGARRNHLDSIIQALEVSAPREQDRHATRSSARWPKPIPRRGMMVLISDLLVDARGLVPRAEAAAQPRARRAGLPRAGRRRTGFPLHRPDALRGPGDCPRCCAAIRGRCARATWPALGDYLEEVRRGCTGNNVDYALLRTSQPLDAALAAYLSNRLGMHHGNRG